MKTQFNGRIIRVLFVGLLTICFPINVLSASVKTGFCGDSVQWSLSEGVLTITGSGQMQNFHKGKRPWRGNIKSVIIEEGVTNIGSRAFEYNSWLKEISIPSSVKTIGDSTFLNCKNLKKIVIPNSVTAIGKACFAKCIRLDYISLSGDLQFIGEKVFEGCVSITDISIPNSVKTIGDSAFLNCINLKRIIIPNSVTAIGKACFSKCIRLDYISLSGDLQFIGEKVFDGCVSITNISIPSSVKTIGDSAFLNCMNLKKIVIPNSVTGIGKACFAGCSKLNSIILSGTLQFIGERAFDGCVSMTDIIIPDSVHHIGDYAFRGCHALTIMIVPDEPFEIVGKDSVLGLYNSKQLSMVRGNHTLCPDYMLKYIPKDCPFMQEGNPRRYYLGSISKDSVVIVPAIKTFTLQEAIDTVENIFNQQFSLANPCLSFSETEEYLSRFIINLERPVYQELLQHYYDAFYEAGSNNDLDTATALAFKHVMLGGKEDEELMWDIILTKYGFENATNNLRFLMRMFNEISIAKDSVYQHTIDSITSVYYDVMYPTTLRSMQGYWVSIDERTNDDSLAPIPDYIINVADIRSPNGTTILSSPKCKWSVKKKKGKWQNQTQGYSPLRYSYEIGYNQETQTLQILFGSQNKKIANTALQHQSLDMVQNLEAMMSASLEQYQSELNRQLAANVLSFNDWGAISALGLAINFTMKLAVAIMTDIIIYASNIETAEAYEIRLTPLVPQVLDVSVKYGYARHNYNNGKTQHTEDTTKLTFVKWEETDSVVFISRRVQPIFCGDTLPVNSPLLEKFNAKKDKMTCQEINQTAMNKLRQKAERLLRLKEEEESILIESSDNEEESNEEVFFY